MSTMLHAIDQHVVTTANLGPLAYARRKDQEPGVVELRFEHGRLEIDAAALTQLVRAGQEALVAGPRVIDCSGAVVDLGDEG